jgi:RNA polymerase sigma factor (sigma-70 family)
MADWEAVARELVAERYDALVAYATMVASSRSNAEDLVQEALLATFARPRGLNNRIVAETYVRRAILTRHLDDVRKTSREKRAVASSHEPGFVDGPDAAVASAHDLRSALGRLTPRERVCVIMRHFENFSVRETAQAVGISAGAVKRYVSDGMGKLNRILGTRDELDQTIPVTARKGGAR